MAVNSNLKLGAKISAQLDHSKMHNRLCAKQLRLKYFRETLFWGTEAKFGSFGNFHKPSHTEDVWKIAKPPKYCFSFSKQSLPENNIFSLFWTFFPGSTLKNFSLTFCPKFFSWLHHMCSDSQKDFGAKSQCKIFHGGTLRESHLNSEKPVGF